MSSGVGVGDPAPDFTLAATDGSGRADARRDLTLSDFRGMVVVLVFYPADSTPGCTAQLTTYTADIPWFCGGSACD